MEVARHGLVCKENAQDQTNDEEEERKFQKEAKHIANNLLHVPTAPLRDPCEP
jgi:hypothetical protein